MQPEILILSVADLVLRARDRRSAREISCAIGIERAVASVQ